MKDAPEHDPIPSPATYGLLCTRCGTRLWAWLTEIPDLYATLDTRKPDTVEQDGSRHLKVSGSPALVRLDVVALMDPRTVHSEDGLVHVPGVICQWAQCLSDDLDLAGPGSTLTEAVELLTTWWESLIKAPWVDEFWAEAKDVRSLLGRAHGEKRPKSIGRCLTVTDKSECGERLYLAEGRDTIKCRKCGRTYDGTELLRVQIQAEREGA